MNNFKHDLMTDGDRVTRDKINMQRSFGAKAFKKKKAARQTADASRRTNRTK